MQLSTRAFATAELAANAPETDTARGGRGVMRRIASTPTGLLGLGLTGITIGMGLLAHLIAPADPFALAGPPLAAPSAAHPMGTDALGRDLLAGVLHGARASLIVAAAVGAMAFALGAGIGLLAGYRGGWLDDLLMRITELVQVVPRFIVAVVVIALFGPGLDRVVLALGITSWPVLARVVRAETLSLRELEFVRAAEVAGAAAPRIIWSELLPNVLPVTLVVLGLLIGQVLLIEASLGFIGIGDPAMVSWGMLAGEAQGFLRAAWWLPLFPGLAITAAVLGFSLLADALSSALGGR